MRNRVGCLTVRVVGWVAVSVCVVDGLQVRVEFGRQGCLVAFLCEERFKANRVVLRLSC